MTTNETCESIEGQFAWLNCGTRCGRPAVGRVVDPTWGTTHPVCADHLAAFDAEAEIADALDGGAT